MRNLLLFSLLIPFTALTIGCGKAETVWVVPEIEPAEMPKPPPPLNPPQLPPPPAPYEAPPAIDFGRAVDEGMLKSSQFSPNLEILFVIDNSTSMEKHINNLSRNIDSFVDAFTRNTPFNYNVAVMSVYDHRRFKGEAFQEKFGGTELEFDVGEFRPVDGKRNFIRSSDNNVARDLKKALKIGIQSLQGSGPEVEESFPPIAAAYGFGDLRQSPKTKEKQKDFFMGQNSYKIIFIVTDASDNSLISADDLYYNLVARSNGNTSKVMGFGAISQGRCKRDPGVENNQIEQFLELSRMGEKGSNVVSLCENFGSKFAQFGQSIRKAILSQSIPLTQGVADFRNPNAGGNDECLKPEGQRNPEAVVVCYGAQRIYLRTTVNGPAGYRYNAQTNSIHLDEDLQFAESEKGAVVTVEYTPIHAESRQKGLVRAWGQK